MIMKNENDSFHIGKLLKRGESIAPTHWQRSGEINKSIAASLLVNEEFLADVRATINEFGIPGFGDFLRATYWFRYELSESEQRKFNAHIILLLKGYELPLNFMKWVIEWILVGKAPDWKPLYNNESFEYLEEQLENGLPLTTQEKKFLRQSIRKFHNEVLKKKGLPENYKKVLVLIDAAKNTRRKLKNLQQDLSIVEQMNQRRRHKGKRYRNYLAIAIKGKSEKEMRDLERKNPWDVEIVPRHTSKGVAMKVGLGRKKSKDSYVRKRFERFKKRVKKIEN